VLIVKLLRIKIEKFEQQLGQRFLRASRGESTGREA
jgi:hypothetical protein